MNKKFKIRKGDKVIIKTGRDKGKVGEVMEIITKTNRVKIQGANMLKKHRKPTQQVKPKRCEENKKNCE